MNNFQHIQDKLKRFVKKYYVNELIRGSILFFSIGLLYFLFTLVLESFLWLNPTFRTLLFWMFILVELALLFKFICIPLFRLFGLSRGISNEQASQLIGMHFSEIDDKLLNVLQLQKGGDTSELLLASIEQKSSEIRPIHFNKAINFRRNTKYLKFAVIPVLVILISFVFDLNKRLSDSYDRVLHHKMVYTPPAPFSFVVHNRALEVVEGSSITITLETLGAVVPSDVEIHFLDQKYFVQNTGLGTFEYTFSSVQRDIPFYFSSGDVISNVYKIQLVNAPRILDFEIDINYPNYIGKQDEQVRNTGNLVVPEGTDLNWRLSAQNTDSIVFKAATTHYFSEVKDDYFEFDKRASKSFSYAITTSNAKLKEYEQLNYSVEIIPDAFPKIEVQSNIDSLESGPAKFLGLLTDDYGLTSLKLYCATMEDPSDMQHIEIEIQATDFERFYYNFPEGLDLEEGFSYEFYFEVYDNDAVNGIKSTRSRTYSYYQKTESEIEEERLKNQRENLQEVERTLEKNKTVQKEMSKTQERLQNKSEMNWNDQKTIQSFIERQQMYDAMMQRQTQELQRNLEQQPNVDHKELQERKEDVQQRLKEAEELAKQEELLNELEQLAEKLDKEELIQKLKKLSETNRQKERNLERILELTKRYYVEQKSNQISEALEELSEKQLGLSEREENSSEAQGKLQEEFQNIQKELDQLEKDNNALERPMKLADTKREEDQVQESMQDAEKKLQESESENGDGGAEKAPNDAQQSPMGKAKKSQKSAAQKMKEMSQKMQGAMQSMQGESMDEDIDMLRAILENLLIFSFEQEELMNKFSRIDNAHPEYAEQLKKQQVLREYFEHIDDSLYTLSMRQPKIGTTIFKELSDVHYHLAESLEHFADDQFNVAQSDQQFVMTATNNIAYVLSNILNSMQNASPSMGQGQGSSFSLPDIIKKQDNAIEQMEQGMKKGKKPGEELGEDGEPKSAQEGTKPGEGEGEEMSGELYEIYKEQAQLRNMLEQALKGREKGKGELEQILGKMEQLEQDLLEKGYSSRVLEQMQAIKHELLKLEEAVREQGIDTDRESKTNRQKYIRNSIDDIDEGHEWFNEDELLNRQSLPLKPQYKKRVQEYFKTNDRVQ